MKIRRTSLLFVFVLLARPAFAKDDDKTGPDSPLQPTQAQTPEKKTYKLGPDSLPQEGVPQGKLEGPLLFRSKVLDGTVRQYWIYVPAQYQAEKPACVLVFQDGQRAVNPKGVLRVPTVMDNLIHRKEMPV